jgi:hypothetical protein
MAPRNVQLAPKPSVPDYLRRYVPETPRPIYIRLPRPHDRCPHTGLSRSGMTDLCVPGKNNNFKPPVKSLYLKKDPTVKRAVRLVDFQSLLDYLAGHSDAVNDECLTKNLPPRRTTK